MVFATILFLVAGAINLYPVIGLLNESTLTRLYGVTITDPNLLLLMRHRAVLFGIIGGIILTAAFRPDMRLTAAIVGLVSMLSFVVLIILSNGYNAELRSIFIADIIGSVILGSGYMLGRLVR